ncbi:MAG: pyruvate:ferredoxin (flavodoxin) oxidoreductase [Planctomycetaceae bacterium]
MERQHVTIDANEATALVAHATNEVIAIYPITPASPMGEWADAWTSSGRENLFGVVPQVIEMQSEAGAAGTVHGALQAGALTTTFTASQGLLLMIPNMFKIAGELTPTVFHIAARTVATHALSIFGDHSDVMAVRSTGWTMLFASSVQEAHDFALISQAATLASRVPILHIFDGFRTSHEINRIEVLSHDDMRNMLPDELIEAHRRRALSPDRPVLRGSAQNPDVFFQAREAINPYYEDVPRHIQETMDKFAELIGRAYRLYEYVGAPDAESVIVLMGSGCGAVEEVVESETSRGAKIGVLKIRLFRPFDIASFIAALPNTVKQIAVLDRTKEPGATGEPLYQDVVTALVEGWPASSTGKMPRVIGGRYGLSSKEFTPAMVLSIFDELAKPDAKRHFTIGIHDDVTHLSLRWDNDRWREPKEVKRAVFFGLGSDGTVSANKNSVKIIGENTPLWAQGYFVYDSKKAGSVTVSHLRFSPRPIRSTYLIAQADFVACHQFQLLFSMDVLSIAEQGATFLLNSAFGPDEVWEHLPQDVQRQILDKQLRFFVVDGYQVAQNVGLGRQINTVMQTCFFSLSKVLPIDEAIAQIKTMIAKSYGKRGQSVLQKNYDAVDAALHELHEVAVPLRAESPLRRRAPVPEHVSDDFVHRVTSMLLAGQGDLLPVSALPVDGTYPTGTARYEKRSIAIEIPIWDPDICIQCGLCALVCPHAAIRSKAYPLASVNGTPEGFKSLTWSGKNLPDYLLTIQVAPDDCTGCGVCVDVCPARSKEVAKHKAINMEPKLDHLERERTWYDHFLSLPELDRTSAAADSVKGSQLLQPLFEYSGACAGCGETPYLKLLTQLFGDRALVANATGCSSIYGGNLPTTPWSKNSEGRGPAWSNSLFEDNAEFGLGMRLAVNQLHDLAVVLLKRLASRIGEQLVTEIIEAPQSDEAGIIQQRQRVDALRRKLATIDSSEASQLREIADSLVRRSVWIVGGDGWAYDIGFGGLDHVFASGRDVNILVLDTEVYSNTGGQASKSTPRAAVAKFASGGKLVGKKDLGMTAVDYGNVYVAQVAMGAHPLQTIRAFHEAESYCGTSLIIAYSPCIAHGIDMSTMMTHQKVAVNSAYWPLFRYDPRLAHDGGHPFHLDSRKPTISFHDFAQTEARYAMLSRANPEHADQLMARAQQDINDRWHFYEQMAGIERDIHTGAALSIQEVES